jgi:hypothetical protein
LIPYKKIAYLFRKMIPWSMDGVVRREDMIFDLKRKLKVLKNIFFEKNHWGE